MLEYDQGTLSMNLPSEAYGTDENAVVGAWLPLEPDNDSDSGDEVRNRSHIGRSGG